MEEFATFFVLAMIGFKRILGFVVLCALSIAYWYFGTQLIDLIPLSSEYYRGLLHIVVLLGIPLIICCIWIIKIVYDPALTKEDKINRLFGKH